MNNHESAPNFTSNILDTSLNKGHLGPFADSDASAIARAEQQLHDVNRQYRQPLADSAGFDVSTLSLRCECGKSFLKTKEVSL